MTGHITTSHSSHVYLSEPIDICHHCQLIQTVVVYLAIQASVLVGASVTAVANGTKKHQRCGQIPRQVTAVYDWQAYHLLQSLRCHQPLGIVMKSLFWHWESALHLAHLQNLPLTARLRHETSSSPAYIDQSLRPLYLDSQQMLLCVIRRRGLLACFHRTTG